MKERFFSWILITSVVAFPLGCGRSANMESPDGGKTAITPRPSQLGGGAVPERPESQADKPAVVLEGVLPSDVPVPPKAKPTSLAKSEKVTSIKFETSEPVSDVVSFYNAALASRGWAVQGAVSTRSGSMIGATKGPRTLNVIVGKIDTTTIIALDVGQP